MSKRKVTLAINNITIYLNELNENDPTVFNKTLKALGVNKIVYERCYSLKLYRLANIYDCLDILAELYEFDGDKLTTLARNIKKVHKENIFVQTSKKAKSKTKGNKTHLKNPPQKVPNSSNERLLRKIDARANNECCLCATFNELSKISQKEFISLMKRQYSNICSHKLSLNRVNSWKDEYNQITKEFIPVFKEFYRNLLNYHIVFELKLPLDPKDLSLDKYVYADAVIVCDNGFVVLEFKQRKKDVVDFYWKEALKYVHRLRYHKVGRLQNFKYSYLVCTLEKEDGLWFYENKKHFWFGNSKNVAEDISVEFEYVLSAKPCDDIERWLTAGFKEKKVK